MEDLRKAYPVFIKESSGDFLVYVPDLDIYTEGRSFPDAISMARDAIGLKWTSLTDSGKDMPLASTIDVARKKAKQDADEEFDYSEGILTFVDVDLAIYQNKLRNRAVKKNCTIPQWLNEEAEKRGVNFSKILQDALMQKLNLA